MKEIEQILSLWSQLEEKGEAAVLATVMKTSGSSYRLPGARLLLGPRGERAGSVSGGCLEDDLLKKAWWLTESGPVVRRYDTTRDGEIAVEYGLGCNGIVHVLLERVAPGQVGILDLLRNVRQTRVPAVVWHRIDTPGQRTVIRAETDIVEHGDMFVETLVPALRLLIFGAGEDAVPLVNLAKFFGWQVHVFDGRSHYARRDKFPNADSVNVRNPGGGPELPIDSWTAAVLMSHSYSQDRAMLEELAHRELRYLGVLGPRKRAEQMLAEAGINEKSESPALHSPMGLDIGADGPDQVALSVIAEIQATLNGRRGGLLRERAGSIHSADMSDPASAWVPSIVCA